VQNLNTNVNRFNKNKEKPFLPAMKFRKKRKTSKHSTICTVILNSNSDKNIQINFKHRAYPQTVENPTKKQAIQKQIRYLQRKPEMWKTF